MPERPHEVHSRRILAQVQAGTAASQRFLARELGIALGLTNLLVREMTHKGWIQRARERRNRVRYLITPAGVAEMTRMSRTHFTDNLRSYRETRDRIRESFAALSAELGAFAARGKWVAFYGAGEVAEIAYICLQETDLQLAGVVDEQRTNPFLGIPVYAPDCVKAGMVGGRPFDRLVIMSFDDADGVRARLRALGVAADRVFWL